MKRCPACNRTYADLSLNFCLDDGTPLTNDAAPTTDLNATVRYPPPRDTSEPPPTEIYRPTPPRCQCRHGPPRRHHRHHRNGRTRRRATSKEVECYLVDTRRVGSGHRDWCWSGHHGDRAGEYGVEHKHQYSQHQPRDLIAMPMRRRTQTSQILTRM